MANEILNLTLGQVNGLSYVMVSNLLKGLLHPEGQIDTNLCWACSSSTSLKTSILDATGVNLPAEYIFKFLVMKKLKQILMTKTLNQIVNDDFAGTHHDVIDFMTYLPIFTLTEVSRVLQISFEILPTIETIKNELVSGIRPFGALHPPDFPSSHAMLLVGLTRSGQYKYLDSYSNGNDLMILPAPQSLYSAIIKYLINDIPIFNEGREIINKAFHLMNNVDEVKKIVDQYIMDQEESKSDDPQSFKDANVNTDVITKFSKNFVKEFTYELSNNIPIRNDLSRKIFINGHWRYKKGMKPTYIDDPMDSSSV